VNELTGELKCLSSLFKGGSPFSLYCRMFLSSLGPIPICQSGISGCSCLLLIMLLVVDVLLVVALLVVVYVVVLVVM